MYRMIEPSSVAGGAACLCRTEAKQKHVERSEPANLSKVLVVCLKVIRSIALLPLMLLDKAFRGAKIGFKAFDLREDLAGHYPSAAIRSSARDLKILTDPLDSYQAKLALARGAKNSLDITGYCGGQPFLELLGIIEGKLKKNPNFKSRVITNYDMINSEEKALFDRLHRQYPTRFECVVASAVYVMYPTHKRCEMHAKMMVADQKRFIMGGTGVTNRLLGVGNVKSAPGRGAFLSDGNRDIDISGSGGVAKALTEQFDVMWRKWKLLRGRKPCKELDVGRSVVGIQGGSNPKRVAGGEGHPVSVILSGPEQGKSNLGLKAYVNAIESAQDSILISNMVFNEPKILAALERAARKRGVKVRVLSNGYTDDAPTAAKTLAPRARRRYAKLLKSGRVSIYEYGEKDVLLHSKVMVVDEKTLLLGSFNISRESTRCDDETLVVLSNKDLAKQVIDRIEQFIEASTEVTQETLKEVAFRKSLVTGWFLEALFKNVLN